MLQPPQDADQLVARHRVELQGRVIDDAANERLRHMRDNRYTLHRAVRGSRSRSRTGLDLEAVFDYAPHYRAGQRMTCGSFVPTLNPGAGAQAGGQPSVMRQLLDTTRMQAASPREQQAVEAIFSALESVDLNAVANAAQRR